MGLAFSNATVGLEPEAAVPVILGVDTGFSDVGWALVAARASGPDVLDIGLIRTQKASKKRRLLDSEDNIRRGREIAAAFEELSLNPRLAFLAVESQSWPRNSSVSAKIGHTWGILCSLAHRRGLTVLQYSPQDLKQASTGKKTATKSEMISVARALMSPDLQKALERVPRTKQEHIGDAVCVGATACGSGIVKSLKKMQGG